MCSGPRNQTKRASEPNLRRSPASLTHRRPGYPLRSCVPTELLSVSPGNHNLHRMNPACNNLIEHRSHASENPGGLGAGPQDVRRPNKKRGIRRSSSNQVLTKTKTVADRVAQGSFLPWAPTDPYGHALVHTVPQVMGSLRVTSRTRRSARLSVSVSWTHSPNFEAFDVFLKYGSITRCLASLRRVRQGAVPRVHRYYQDTMTSCRPSRVASLPSLGDTTGSHSCFRSRAASATTRAWSWSPGSSGRDLLPWRRQDLPSSWATPIIRLHMLFDSGETVRSRPIQSNRVAPATGTAKALAMHLSKLNHMAFGLAVYASSRSLPRATQDSLPAVGQTLPDGLPTRRVAIEGFQFTSCQSSPSAKLLGAIPFTSSVYVLVYVLVPNDHIAFNIEGRTTSIRPDCYLQVQATSLIAYRYNGVYHHRNTNGINFHD